MAGCTGRDMGERQGKAPEKTGVTYADKFYDDAGGRCLTTRLVQDDDYLYPCGSTALYRVDRPLAPDLLVEHSSDPVYSQYGRWGVYYMDSQQNKMKRFRADQPDRIQTELFV